MLDAPKQCEKYERSEGWRQLEVKAKNGKVKEKKERRGRPSSQDVATHKKATVSTVQNCNR